MDNPKLKLFQKLLYVQQNADVLKKSSTAKIPTKSGKEFSYSYANLKETLRMLKPLLNGQGLILSQPIKVIEGRNILYTIVMDAESGEYEETTMILMEHLDPQKQGAIITYFRKYELKSMFALEEEDDDCNQVGYANTAQQPTYSPVNSTPSGDNICACGNVIKGNYQQCYQCNQR